MSNVKVLKVSVKKESEQPRVEGYQIIAHTRNGNLDEYMVL